MHSVQVACTASVGLGGSRRCCFGGVLVWRWPWTGAEGNLPSFHIVWIAREGMVVHGGGGQFAFLSFILSGLLARTCSLKPRKRASLARRSGWENGAARGHALRACRTLLFLQNETQVQKFSSYSILTSPLWCRDSPGPAVSGAPVLACCSILIPGRTQIWTKSIKCDCLHLMLAGHIRALWSLYWSSRAAWRCLRMCSPFSNT